MLFRSKVHVVVTGIEKVLPTLNDLATIMRLLPRSATGQSISNYFSLLTGGNYISPLHRVASPDKERISGVFFYYPSFDAEIPLMGQQDYSLFKNQQQDGNALDKEVIAAKPFGKYIQEKWEQVQRK